MPDVPLIDPLSVPSNDWQADLSFDLRIRLSTASLAAPATSPPADSLDAPTAFPPSASLDSLSASPQADSLAVPQSPHQPYPRTGCKTGHAQASFVRTEYKTMSTQPLLFRLIPPFFDNSCGKPFLYRQLPPSFINNGQSPKQGIQYYPCKIRYLSPLDRREIDTRYIRPAIITRNDFAYLWDRQPLYNGCLPLLNRTSRRRDP